MDGIYTVSFFGHRVVQRLDDADGAVYGLICALLREKERLDFLVGFGGDFNDIVSAAVRRARKAVRDDTATLTLVLPYENAATRKDSNLLLQYYDAIEVDVPADTYFKAAYSVRNRRVIDRSDLCVFYVERESGGAYAALCYARKKGKGIINFAENMKRLQD